MHASRRTHRTDRDAAVSAVVGSIVLVAIAIMIAVTIAFLVQRTKDSASLDERRPEIGFQVDNNDPAVTVVRAEGGLDWVRDLDVSGSCAPTLNGDPFPTTEGTPVLATDLLECGWAETLTISSSEDRGNAVLFRHTF